MEYQFSDRLKNLSGNAIREIFKLLENPEVISFAGGMPATQCLPIAQFRAYVDELLTGPDAAKLMQYGSTEGYLPLRRAMTEYVKRCGIEGIGVENVLIVSGGQQGMDLCCKLFLNKGDRILVEDPTYLAALHITKTYEGVAIGVDSGDQGIDVDDLERKIKQHSPKFFYVVPNFSNPTGRTLSREKRKAIVELCARHNVLIVEDDPYRELRYSGEPLPSLKSFDREGGVIYVTSFSKTISPAMRVGAVIADERIIRKLTIGKQATDVHTVTLMQAVAERFLTSGELDRQLASNVPVYREKRDAMLRAIAEYMPESFRCSHPDGGLFIWGEFPAEISAKAKFREAVERCKVAYVCGNDFFADGRGDNCMRLNFSNASLEQIDTGIQRLAGLFR